MGRLLVAALATALHLSSQAAEVQGGKPTAATQGLRTSNARPQESPWKPLSSGPLLTRGAKGEWDEWAVGSMSVVLVGTKFHLFYEGWGLRTIQIGHATSSDGSNWTKDSANPVLPRSEQGWENGGTWDPFVIHEDGVFKMWYGGAARGKKRSFQWGYATSTNGSHFTRRGQISRFPKGEVEDVHVVHDRASGRYLMYYWDRNFEPMGLFCAQSADEIHFDFEHATPIRIDGLPYPAMYKFTHVIQEEGQWWMFFGEFVRPRCQDCWTGLATSTDGLRWTVVNRRIIRGQDAEVLKVKDDSFLLFYGPDGFFDGEGCDIRLARFHGKLRDCVNR